MDFEKNYNEPSIFTPENLLRESRRQKKLDNCNIPTVCILDPDGDIIEYLLRSKKAEVNTCWACYHTKLYNFKYEDLSFGIIGSAVGAPFAVLLAEQLFVSGCELLISITSAGVINNPPNNSKFILIEKAYRDEGTSRHYLPASEETSLNKTTLEELLKSFNLSNLSVEVGISWTTDAPYRETNSSIQLAKQNGIIAVEMEASALYAFAIAKSKNIVCYAHLTNTMAQNEVDFEKGLENGSIDSLELIYHTAKNLWK